MMLSRTFLVYVLSTKSIPNRRVLKVNAIVAQSLSYCCSKSMLLVLKVNAIGAQSQCYKSSNSLTLVSKINEFEVSVVGGR